MNRVSQALLWVLASAVVAEAAPPVVTVPSEVKGEVGAFVAVRASVSDAKVIEFVSLTAGLNVFPADLLADKTATVVTSAKAGRFTLLCYSGNADGPSKPATVTVVIGDASGPIVTPPPKEPPGTTPTDIFYFAVVRPNGAASKEMEAIMALPAWDELRKAGHSVRAFTVDELPALKLDVPSTVPMVLLLKQNSDKATWTDTKNNKALPTTNEAIRSLLK